jgi:hypothetical protein
MQLVASVLPLIALVTTQDIHPDNNQQAADVDADLLSWQAPERFNTEFPYYHSGYDYDNRAVIVLEYGKWHTRSVVEESGEDLRILERRQDQLIEQLRTSFFKRQLNQSESGSNDNEFAFIMDLSNYDFTQFSSKPNLKYLVEYFAKFNKVYEKFGYGFIVNVSTVGDQLVMLFNIAAGKYLSKCEVHGTNSKLWKPRILKKIPKDQISPAYGGSEGFKPVSFYG